MSYSSNLTSLKNTVDIVDSLILGEYMEQHQKLNNTLAIIHQVPEKIDIRHRDIHQMRLVVTGEDAQKQIIKNWRLSPNQVAVIKPAIEVNWQTKQHHSQSPKKILMVANYLPQKGYELLLPILSEMSEVDWQLTAYGNKKFNPKFHNSLQCQISNSPFKSKVKLKGTIDRESLNQAYIDADVLLHCAAKETYGMAVAEAVQSKLPSIIFATGNWKDFETTGWAKVIHSHSAKAFAKAIKNYFNKPNTFPIPSRNTTTHPRRNWEDVVDEIEKIIQSNH